MRKRKVIIGMMMVMSMLVSITLGDIPVRGDMVETDESTITGVDEVKIASIKEPIVDASTGAVTFSYVYFGSYPQSKVTGEALTEEIINAEYVSGEAVVAKERYRRVITEDGEYHYFKYEPIKWRVIWVDDNITMLRSEYILDCKPYNKDNMLEYGNDTSWVRTTIRCWLNGIEMYKNKGFLQSAFSDIEQYGIVNTTIFEENYNIDVEHGADDKIILLHKWFIIDNFWNEQTLTAVDTEYATTIYGRRAECNQWMINNDFIGFYAYVDSNGIIHEDEVLGCYHGDQTPYYKKYADEICGVCPAIQLDLSYIELWMTEEEYLASLRGEQITWVRGDVNKDGIINLTDAQLILRFSLKIENCTKVQAICADDDSDGNITLTDAQQILRKALKIE